MANTLTNLKDLKVAQTALSPWMSTLLPLTSFSTNLSSEIADPGDAVKVPIIGLPTASSNFNGDYTVNADSEANSVTVTLDRHKFKTVHMTARELDKIAVPLLEKLVSTAAQQLAADVIADILSCVTEANYGAPAIDPVTAEDFNYRDIIKIREVCGKAKMPNDQRNLILDSSLFSSLLADEIVAKSFISGLAQPGVVEARISRLVGFNVYETNVLPSNNENLVGIAAHPSSLAVGMRYLAPVASYDEAGAVTDPTTGLTFGYLRYSDTKSNKIYITLEALYGFKVIRPEGLKRIVSA